MKEYGTIIGLLLMVFLAVLLFTSPQDIFGGGCYVATEPSTDSGDRTHVILKTDLSHAEELKDFPRQIGEWQGFDHEISRLEQTLQADVALLRTYAQDELIQPLFLALIHSSAPSSFHHPPYCYTCLGYKIEEVDYDRVYVPDTEQFLKSGGDINRPPQRAQEEPGKSAAWGWVPVNKLVVFKQKGDEVTERRLVLYFYIMENKIAGDTMNMVRVSALIPISEPYDGTLNSAREFMGETIPLLFAPAQTRQKETLVTHLLGWGPGGYVVIFLLFSIPIAISIYSRLAARRDHTKTQDPTEGETYGDDDFSNQSRDNG
ncbi:exosortase-associated EpsI family protein [Chloroflexota bacterium]